MRTALAGVIALTLMSGTAQADHRFNGGGGWNKARDSRQSIQVWSTRQLQPVVAYAIRPWNKLAGQRLFSVVASKASSDVQVRPSRNDWDWTKCWPEYDEDYNLCVVYLTEPSVRTLEHELGHALGFADHIYATTFEQGRHFDARVCDDVTHTSYSKYRGVMSYCDWHNDRARFGRHDRRMLVRAGYSSSSHS